MLDDYSANLEAEFFCPAHHKKSNASFTPERNTEPEYWSCGEKRRFSGCALSVFIQGASQAPQPLGGHFRVPAHAQAEMPRHLKEMPGHHAGLVFFAQQAAELLSGPFS
jgi:hypothetical protein